MPPLLPRRFRNRFALLSGYLRRRSKVAGLPVEYIVETTAKCNLYCPMCPRETHPQPKADMADSVFDALVQEAAQSAEQMMLIGLGEPFLDPKIFDRVEYCSRHNISTLLSTNGTLLDESLSLKVLESPLKHITLSFDGATKESFEFYRKGARFERVRENFVRFARLKHEQKRKVHVTVQMVRLPRNRDEVTGFTQFWTNVPGVNTVRVKEDETNLFKIGHEPRHFAYPCHYLWRGPVYVKQNGDIYPCCQSYMLDGKPIGRVGEAPLVQIWNSKSMQELRTLHAENRAGEIPMCARCCSSIPHPALVIGSLLINGETVRKILPRVEAVAAWSTKTRKLLQPSK